MAPMDERHENEQYFFTADTLAHLSAFLARYSSICVICAPMLGKALAERGAKVTILDIDERFADLPGFRHWDLSRPNWLGEEFDIIVCDPPFFNVSLSQLFQALRLLARNSYEQKLLVSYLHRRSRAVLSTFRAFALEPTGFEPRYQTVQEITKNRIEFFSNLGSDAHRDLASSGRATGP